MHFWLTLRLLTLLAVLSQSTYAQSAAESVEKAEDSKPTKLAAFEEPAEDKKDEPDATEKREDVSEKLRVAKKVLDSAEKATASGSAAPEPLAKEVKLLKQLEAIHAQQQAAENRTAELQTAKAELEGKLKVLHASGTTEERPFTFTRLELLRDELALETNRLEPLTASLKQRQQSLERAKKQLQDKESARRKAKEAVEMNSDKTKNAELATAAELAQLESKLASETEKLRKLKRDNEQLVFDTHEMRTAFVAETVAAVAQETALTDDDKQQQLDAVQNEEVELEWLRDDTQTQHSLAEQRLTEAKARLEDAEEKSPVLLAEVDAHHLSQQIQQQTLDVVNQRLGRVANNRTAWTRRFKIQEQSFAADEVVKWGDETRQLLEQLDREQTTQIAQLADWRRESTALEKKFADQPTSDNQEATWRSEQQSHRQKLAEVYENNQQSIEASQQLLRKLLADIEGAGVSTAGIDFSVVWDRAAKLWNYELVAVDDRPITPRKIATGLFLLVLGIYMARWVSHFLGRRILSRLRMHPNAAHATQSLTFYVMIFLVALSSLHVANVPLAAFTILGGALALGVGFGSQNIINNFISGLIILAERPVRVGDLIEIDTFFATVDRIGARSTRLRTGANLEIIVPNSRFLEQNVVNWTLSDTTVRSKVCIGVAYDSPTEMVRDILVEVASAHEYVLNEPEPYVLFTDFADNSLNFEIRFWIRASQLFARVETESDLRYAINRRFHEANISIAFPQRDVHLDTNGPIAVQMVEPMAAPQAKAA
jgi:potassium efflux system protein